ncbi:hypothetical protein STXM2123_5123 [Streptomyces sp. F-3]|nr:hypothetical protein STXM2123_5123 [Streptomyces sp. F-3]
MWRWVGDQPWRDRNALSTARRIGRYGSVINPGGIETSLHDEGWQGQPLSVINPGGIETTGAEPVGRPAGGSR